MPSKWKILRDSVCADPGRLDTDVHDLVTQFIIQLTVVVSNITQFYILLILCYLYFNVYIYIYNKPLVKYRQCKKH